MSRVIEAREGVEVYVSETGNVCIKQDSMVSSEPAVVIVHPGDVEALVAHLQDALQEALAIKFPKST